MLDLKSKLLAAGLVTQEQVDKVEAAKHRKKTPRPVTTPVQTTPVDNYEEQQRQKALADLKKLPKGEQYDVIRRWVTRNRLDKTIGLPSEKAEKYFFQKLDGVVTWLTLEPEVLEQINLGKAGIMAYMSNNGMAHSVVPSDIIEDVSQVFPDWVRVVAATPSSPIPRP